MKPKILLTGGAGYIGSHTLIQLLEKGHDVLVLDNLSNSKLETLDRVKSITKKNFEFIKGDIRDRDILKKIFKYQSIKSVIHFAGLKAVGEAEKFPIKYYENNVLGSLNLFHEMELAEVKTIVFSSSATVYGKHTKNKYDEDTPTRPINVYGRTKHIVENILRDIKKSDDNWSIGLLRYFNPVGAHASGIIGENPKEKPNNLLPYISQVAAGLREKLFIFGNDYPTSDGTGRRDYIHIEDLSSAHIKTLYLIQNTKNKLFTLNLGTGKSHSVFEMINQFEEVSGKEIPFQVVDRRPGDLAEFYADASKAEKLLDWKANRSVKEMCEDTWRWQKNNLLNK